MTLDEILARLGALPPAERKAIEQEAYNATKALRWVPNPGPQTDAYFSEADDLLYGGEPGGGKSQLILGLAFNCHERSLVMRREYGDLERLIDDALKINGGREGFNGSPPPRLRISDKKVINFRAAQRIGDEQGTMGQGRDLLGIDEATHFAESQVRFLMGWVRTETPGQRCRTVLATNPPLTAEGLWVISMFAPWLDPTYPNPAKPGELRWVISNEEGKDEWVSGRDDVREVRGKLVHPKSRTYIPASVKDNPYYAATDYERQLDALPEPYRSQLLGGFRVSFKDAEWQVIPTAWVEAAQKRWTERPAPGFAMTAMAVDVAGGGADKAVISSRYGGWYGPLEAWQGPETADPFATTGRIITRRRDNCPVIVDLGGGYGGGVYASLKDNGVPVVGFKGAERSVARSKDGKLTFVNKRAEVWWKFREEMDPSQDGGSAVALPLDSELKADLTAPRWKNTTRGIQIEDKEEIKKRIGRSPDKGDAVVMCLSEGNLAAARQQNWSGSLPTSYQRSYENLKRRM